MIINDPALSLRKYLIRGALGSLIFKIGQTGLSLLLAVILARMLGAEGFGVYTFCLSVANLLLIPAMLGGHHLLLREIAAYRAKNEFHFLRGLLKLIKQTSIVTSIILALCTAGIGLWIYRGSQMQYPFLIATALIPLMTAMNLQGAALRGLGHVLIGQANITLLPLLVILIIGFLFLFHSRSLVPESALVAYGLSVGFLVVLAHFLIRRFLPKDLQNVKSEYETFRWIKSMLPFMLVGGMQILNKEVPVIFLGILKDAESVGLFRVSQRGSELIIFGLLAVSMAIAPTIAELYAKGEKYRLQYIISKSTLMITAFALPVALSIIIFGKQLLPFVFGQEYVRAYSSLIFLCLGQLFYACVGLAGVILNMIGMEKFVTLSMAIAAATNVLLNVVMIPLWGPTGAAIATVVSLVISNMLLARRLYSETGFISFLTLKFIVK